MVSNVQSAQTLTIMVYAAGDNDLSEWLLRDLREIFFSHFSKNINITFLFDRNNKNLPDTIIGEIEHIEGTFPSIRPWGEKNTGDPETLTEFINWSVQNAPADEYMLIISGHGDGLTAALDEEDQDVLTLSEISSAIFNSEIHKVDILGFDACEMATFDAAYAFKDVCDILVASEDEEPAFGWYYNAWLNTLAESGDLSPENIAETIAETYIMSCNFYRVPATLSVIDETKMSYLFSSFEELNKVLNEYFYEEKNIVESSFQQASKFGDSGELLDIGSFAEILKNDTTNKEIKTEAESFLNALNDTIIMVETSEGENPAYGITIFNDYPNESNVEYIAQLDILHDIIFTESLHYFS